jgi:alpha-amylase
MTDRFARAEGSTGPCDVEGGLYCGGTWRGTINHLDYIQGMGFDAVMISPVVKNVEGRVSYGEAYHGYWQTDLYSLNSHFGTRQDLLDLSDALHSRGMYLMLDVMVNNMAYMTNGSSFDNIDYSVFNPFDSQDYFHDYCKMNYTDHDVAQRCWLGDEIVALPDLNTPDSTVESMLGQWIQEMVSNYSVDGLRIDAAKHVNEKLLPFLGDASGIFMTGEVFSKSTDYICMYQNEYISSVPNYPVYDGIKDAFTAGKIQNLEHRMAVMKDSCSDVTALLSFSENHDVTRIASLIDDMAVSPSPSPDESR